MKTTDFDKNTDENTWTLLSPVEALERYKIRPHIANNSNNLFFESSIKPWRKTDNYGPWSLVGLLKDDKKDNSVTLQICHIEPEALQFNEFNPLTDKGGFLLLDKNELSALVKLLSKFAKKLDPAIAPTQSTLMKLDYEQLVKFKLQGWWFPESRQYFFIQRTISSSNSEQEEFVTALVFNTEYERSSHLFFSIIQFNLKDLDSSGFDPTDEGLAKIQLDKGCLVELINLLKEQATYLSSTKLKFSKKTRKQEPRSAQRS